ncbi:unnamed protein product, partial [Larinioides sclopetarius]
VCEATNLASRNWSDRFFKPYRIPLLEEQLEESVTSFEVTINDVEVFSKLTVGKFPSIQEVVEIVKAASNGEEITTVTGTEGMCVIS